MSKNSDSFIRWLFNNRCVGIENPCYKIARDVSHIVSRRIDDSPENKVLHCVECHTRWHNEGVSDERIEMLQERRKEYLTVIGRSEQL